jgi:hypothetical protein
VHLRNAVAHALADVGVGRRDALALLDILKLLDLVPAGEELLLEEVELGCGCVTL